MDTDYWHSMDRDSVKKTGLSPDYIGLSTHPFREQLDELKAKIFAGAKNIELSFIATGSGSRAQGQPVPEHFGKEERQELRELAKINQIGLTVHNPANAPPLSGFGQDGFSSEVRAKSLEELKKTIEFAADVARGGPITVHTQEFPRPISDIGSNFQTYKGEAEKSPIYFVDNRTGKLSGIGRDQKIPIPEGGFENPKRDEKTGLIEKWNYKTIKEFEEEAKKENAKNIPRYIQEKILKRDIDFLNIEAHDAAVQARRIEDEFKFVKSIIEDVRNLEKTDPGAAKQHALIQAQKFEAGSKERILPRLGSKEYDNFLANPMSYLEIMEDRFKKTKDAAYEAADKRRLQVEEVNKNLEHLEPVKDYALKQTAQTLSEAAVYAYTKQRDMESKGEKFDSPLVISPENVFPQTFGSTPKELKEIIVKSREQFASDLVEKKFVSTKEEANKIAEERIKATFDIGHVNTWRKYFTQGDKEFNKWILGEVDGLAKQGILGHVHINDNFGYEDIHMTPGQGNAPIKEFVDKIKGEGFTGKMIVEAGNQRGGEGWQVLTGAYQILDSPIYRVDSQYKTWTDIKGSYFAKTGSPNYLVGELAPSKEWTLWSETQLE